MIQDPKPKIPASMNPHAKECPSGGVPGIATACAHTRAPRGTPSSGRGRWGPRGSRTARSASSGTPASLRPAGDPHPRGSHPPLLLPTGCIANAFLNRRGGRDSGGQKGDGPESSRWLTPPPPFGSSDNPSIQWRSIGGMGVPRPGEKPLAGSQLAPGIPPKHPSAHTVGEL